MSTGKGNKEMVTGAAEPRAEVVNNTSDKGYDTRGERMNSACFEALSIANEYIIKLRQALYAGKVEVREEALKELSEGKMSSKYRRAIIKAKVWNR